jgi:hypothetical protein
MQKSLSHLKKLVRLLENKKFIDDSHAYYKTRYDYAGAGSQSDWDLQRPRFIIDIEKPFIKKWSATPPDIVLLTSPAHYRKYYATITGQWGLVPVYPWTSQADVEKEVQHIHASIGKRGKDFVSDRNIHVADWLSHQIMPNGTRPKTEDIATAVWNQARRISRSPEIADEEAAEEARWRKEQELIRKYKAKGKSPHEAERLTTAALRRAEAPASEKARKALARLRRDKIDLQSNLQSNRLLGRTTPLGYALARLLLELPPLSKSPDPERVLARASFLARLLNSI